MAQMADNGGDILFENDVVYQTLHLINYSPDLHNASSDNDAAEFENEERRISGLLSTLENKVLLEKDQELETLKQELFKEREQKNYFQEQCILNANLVSTVRHHIESFITSFVSLTKICDAENSFLSFGNFNNKNEANQFIQTLVEISNQSSNEQKDSSTTINLLEQFNNSLKLIENREYTTDDISQFDLANQVTLEDGHELPEPNCFGQPGSDTAISCTENLQEIHNLEARCTPENFIDPKHDGQNNKIQKAVDKLHGIGHFINISGETIYHCLCGTKHATYHALATHVRYYTLRHLKCSICGKTYTWLCKLERHFKECHKIRMIANEGYKCPSCPRTFNNLLEFNNHLGDIHFSQAAEQNQVTNVLDDVLETHFAESEIGISKVEAPSGIALDTAVAIQTVQNKSTLKHLMQTQLQNRNVVGTHKRKYTADNTFPCVCGKIYFSLNGLKVHIYRQKYGNIFKCPQCNGRFGSNHALIKHSAEKHGTDRSRQNNFGCRICGDTFPSLRHVRIHRKIAHRGIDARVLLNQEDSITEPTTIQPHVKESVGPVCTVYSSATNGNSIESDIICID